MDHRRIAGKGASDLTRSETAPRIRKGLSRRIWKYRWLYVFLIPALIWYIIFAYGPLYGLQIAFRDFKVLKGITGSEWAGLEHFVKMATDRMFWRAAGNTVYISLIKLVFVSTSGLVLALLLNEIAGKKYRAFSASITMLPHFFSWVVIASIIREMASPSTGVINYVITALGGESIYFLGDSNWALFIIIISDIWESAGWNSIIFTAAIAAISPELYEAAEIDGAGRWQQMIHVTLPCIAGTIVVVMVLKVGSMMSAGFDQIFNLYNSATMDKLDIIDTYVYRLGIESSKYSYSSAVGLLKNVINLMLVLLTNWFAKRIGQSGLF